MRFSVVFILGLFLLSGCSESTTSEADLSHSLVNDNPLQVGFFAPGRVNEGFASKVDIQLYNLSTVEHLEESLQLASEQGLKLFLALELPPMHMENISLNYNFEGGIYKKNLPPARLIKLRRTVSRDVFAHYLAPFYEAIKKHPEAVEAIFLGDEPYLNGISFEDLDQMALDIRYLLDSVGLNKVKIGAVFASAMFNASFAQHIDATSSAYTRSIDEYFSRLEAKESRGEASAEELRWLSVIGDIRLTTYDKANNMYLGGGIPTSLDIVGFDFYLSTLLQDEVHNESLQWFAKQKLHPACDGFENTKITELRQALSFWDAEEKMTNDLALQAKQAAKDKAILDQWYTCRTESTLALLERELYKSGRPEREILLVSESSSNGLMAFDKNGNRLADQQNDLIKARVVDEVTRAINVVKKYPINHLLFFTYESQFDWLIKLTIDGAEGIPEALHLIYQNAKRNK